MKGYSVGFDNFFPSKENILQFKELLKTQLLAKTEQYAGL